MISSQIITVQIKDKAKIDDCYLDYCSSDNGALPSGSGEDVSFPMNLPPDQTVFFRSKSSFVVTYSFPRAHCYGRGPRENRAGGQPGGNSASGDSECSGQHIL